MDEPVTLIDNPVVTMIGTAGDCANLIPSNITYGTVSMDATDETGKTLIVTPSGSNGTASYLGEVLFTVAANSYQDEAENKNTETSVKLNVGLSFDDVTSGNWYNAAITYISARGIAVGVGNDLFAPNAQITRAEFIVMLMRAFDIDPNEIWTDNFDDAGTEFYRALEGLDMLPEVDAPDNRSDFDDTNLISDYALESFQVFVAAKIVHGDSNMLRPLDPATRAQAAKVLCKVLIALEK